VKYRVLRQDDHGHVYTVPHEGVWYEHLAEAAAIKRALERRPHKQDGGVSNVDIDGKNSL
jgi:hypothetical protein